MKQATGSRVRVKGRHGEFIVRLEVEVLRRPGRRSRTKRGGKPARPRKPTKLTPAPKVDQRGFADFPATSQERAHLRKKVLVDYFARRDAGETKEVAARAAQAAWVLATGNPIHGRTVRRSAKRIESFGGIQTAPDTAFLDHKSCPHSRRQKASTP